MPYKFDLLGYLVFPNSRVNKENKVSIDTGYPSRISLVSLLTAVLTFVALPANAESVSEKIARALTAAPAEITDEATILDVDLSVLRAGTNGWTCMPGNYLFYGNKNPICSNDAWMKMMAANAARENFSTDTVGISYALAGQYLGNNANPMANVPDGGGVWLPNGAGMMMIFPNMDVVSDLPRDANAGGPWVMWDGTPYAHVMIPIIPK